MTKASTKTNTDSTTVTLTDLLHDCRWTDPEAADGCYMRDYFQLSEDSWTGREAGLQALRAGYLGQDDDGLGVVIPSE